jgi:hypothetical protein
VDAGPGEDTDRPAVSHLLHRGRHLAAADTAVDLNGSKLIYAVREYHSCKDEPKGFGRKDLRNLLVRARIQLGGLSCWCGTTSACT